MMSAWMVLIPWKHSIPNSFNLLEPCCSMYDVIKHEYPVSICNTWHNTPLLKPGVSRLALHFTRSTPPSNCFAKHCRDVRLRQLIFHPQFDTLSPSCKSRTSLATMGSGATELLGLLKGGSPFIWGYYNSTKACGCLHTERMRMNGLLLHYHTCTDKSIGSAKGKACHVWSSWTNWGEYRHKLTKHHKPMTLTNTSLFLPSLFNFLNKTLKLSGFPCLVKMCDHSCWNKSPHLCPGSTLVTFKTSVNFLAYDLTLSESQTRTPLKPHPTSGLFSLTFLEVQPYIFPMTRKLFPVCFQPQAQTKTWMRPLHKTGNNRAGATS